MHPIVFEHARRIFDNSKVDLSYEDCLKHYPSPNNFHLTNLLLISPKKQAQNPARSLATILDTVDLSWPNDSLSYTAPTNPYDLMD
jgi:hypothetical protein